MDGRIVSDGCYRWGYTISDCHDSRRESNDEKTLILVLVLSMMLSVAGLSLANTSRYEVTEPITIEWWHSTRISGMSI